MNPYAGPSESIHQYLSGRKQQAAAQRQLWAESPLRGGGMGIGKRETHHHITRAQRAPSITQRS
jgi:hypothetical protein